MIANIFSDLPSELPEELVETLLDAKGFRLERIVSQGHASPDDFWYDQQQHEWVVLLRGAAILMFENQERRIEMKPGDFINIPAHQKHRVQWTSPAETTVWLAVHYDLPPDRS